MAQKTEKHCNRPSIQEHKFHLHLPPAWTTLEKTLEYTEY